MKSIFKILLIVATMFFASDLSADNQECRSVREKKHAEKIAFITSELALTSEEAEVFWPVYNEWWSEMRKAHQQHREELKKMEELLQQDNPDPVELEAAVTAYCKTEEFRGALMDRYFHRFAKVISIEKIARLYQTEEKYRMTFIQKLKCGEQK